MTRDEARKAATALLTENREAWALRSCWNCNDTHEHLKCFSCGRTFYKGVDITDDEAPPSTEPEVTR